MNENISNKGDEIFIGNISGDVIGVGNTRRDLVAGSGTISVNGQQLAKLPSIYAQSLRAFSEALNVELRGQIISEILVRQINEALNDFAKEIEEVRPDEKNLSLGRRRILIGKFGSLVLSVIRVVPRGAITGSRLFSPLTPFGNVIGESVEKIVREYANE